MMSATEKSSKSPLRAMGWREWVALPDLGIARIKAKIDTGARSSALHAFDIEHFQQEGKAAIRFKVHPQQRDDSIVVTAEAELLDNRQVRSSSGQVEWRPVIQTTVELGGQRWGVELTLTRRDAMGFRMLLGRQAVRDRFVIDPGKSFLHSQET